MNITITDVDISGGITFRTLSSCKRFSDSAQCAAGEICNLSKICEPGIIFRNFVFVCLSVS